MDNSNIYNTIIIDDEPPAITRLTNLLEEFTDTFNIVGKAANGREAINLINRLKPDLIFLDIQMPGMTGFEMLKQLEEMPVVVFCTAYDQYSLDAFNANGIDYLLKPVKYERIEQTISKLNFFRKELSRDKILNLLEKISDHPEKKSLTSITIKNGARITFVSLEDIAYFKSSDKYVSLFTYEGEEKVTELTLSQLEAKLPGNFMRIHRSVIVNTDAVKEVQRYFNSRYIFLLNDINRTKITSGRNYQTQINSWMG